MVALGKGGMGGDSYERGAPVILACGADGGMTEMVASQFTHKPVNLMLTIFGYEIKLPGLRVNRRWKKKGDWFVGEFN